MNMCIGLSFQHTFTIYNVFVDNGVEVLTSGVLDQIDALSTIPADKQAMQTHGTRVIVRTFAASVCCSRLKPRPTAEQLNAELEKNLSVVEASEDFSPPIVGCKAIIAP